MTENHPITLPPELVQQWYNECPEANEASLPYVAIQAARWGADQQLDQDAKWLDTNALFSHNLTITPSGGALRQVMRHKPPSLKEQALETLRQMHIDPETGVSPTALDTIRRALEQLDD